MKRIIIADDDAMVLRSVVRVLKPLSLDIATASDGTIALAMAIENPPALLITDGEMRKMHGPELIRELRKVPATTNIPVIMCSGNSNLEEIATTLGVPFFSKGRGLPKDLISLVQQALG